MVPPYPAAIPDWYSLEVQVYRGYWMVEWFKREFGQHEVATAIARGVEPEALFDELVRPCRPGSMGLTLQPYWSPGIRDPRARSQGRDHRLRRRAYPRAHVSGDPRRVSPMRSAKARNGPPDGPGVPLDLTARSPAAARRAMPRRSSPPTSSGCRSRGSTRTRRPASGRPSMGWSGLGLHPDVPTGAAAMVRVGEVRDPDPATHAVYDDLYRTVYRPMYDRLKPLYREIRRITGYPAR